MRGSKTRTVSKNQQKDVIAVAFCGRGDACRGRAEAMIPFKSPLLLTVPPTLEKRLEALAALRTLQAQDEELVRQRRAAIAALRRDADKLQRDFPVFLRWFETERAEVRRLLKYNPDEPRVPAGQSGGGQWTKDGNAGGPSIASADGAETSSGIQPAASTDDPHVAQIFPPPLLFEDPLFVRPPLAEFPKDPKLPPGPDFEWRGQSGSQPGDPEGSWYNPKIKESLHPDMDHGPPDGPHWDYKAPNKQQYRWFPDGRLKLKS
jgi:hypothetical protein